MASDGTRRVIIGALVVLGLAGGVALFAPGPLWVRPPTGVVDKLDPGQMILSAEPGRLIGLETGIPEASGSPIREARTTFAPDEKVLLHGDWNAGATEPAHWTWLDPEGRIIYSSDLELKPDWTNSWVTYRGPTPMAAGDWKVAVETSGVLRGQVGFRVVRAASEIPVRQQAEAFAKAQIDGPQATALAKAFRDALAGTIEADAVVAAAPQAIVGEQVLVALSVWQEGAARLVHIGQGATLGDSIRDVVAKLKASGADASKAYLELSLVHSAVEVATRPSQIEGAGRRGRGFTLRAGDKTATLLPTAIARSGAEDGTTVLRQLAVDAGLSEDGWKADGVKLQAFRTQDYVLAPDGDVAEPLVDARVEVPPASVDYAMLRTTLDRAADWYMANQKPDGRYMYTFLPAKDLEPPDDWCLRVLNAVFVVAELAVDRPDRPEIRASVNRAIDAFRPAIVERGDTSFIHWKQPRVDSALGSTSFYLSALSTLNDPADATLRKRLANAIMGEQEESGRLSTEFVAPTDRDIDQQYYTGEALLSLVRYHKVSKDPAVIDALEKAFPYYLDYWNKQKFEPFVPWMSRAYGEFHEVKPDPKYADWVFEMTDWLLDAHPTTMPDEMGLGYAGALRNRPTSTGVYNEGLVAAWQLAKRVGDQRRVERYGDAVAWAARFAVQMQYGPHDVYAYPRPLKIFGAIPFNPLKNELQLDETYHPISAVAALVRDTTPEQWDAMRTRAGLTK